MGELQQWVDWALFAEMLIVSNVTDWLIEVSILNIHGIYVHGDCVNFVYDLHLQEFWRRTSWNLPMTSKDLNAPPSCPDWSHVYCRCRRTFGTFFIPSCLPGFILAGVVSIFSKVFMLNDLHFCRTNNCHKVGYVSKKNRKKNIVPTLPPGGLALFLTF